MTRRHLWHIYLLVFLDWATICTSLTAAIMLRGRTFHGDFHFLGTPLYLELFFIALFGALATLVFHYFNLYRVDVFTTVTDHTIRIVKALGITIVGIGLLAFFIRAAFIVDSRLAIIYFTVITFSLMLAGRVIIFRNLYLYLSKRENFRRRALVVGAGDNARNTSVNIFLNDYLGVDVVGYLDDALPMGKTVFNGGKVIGRFHELQDIVKLFEIDEILVCEENIEKTRFFEVLEQCIATGTRVKVSSPLYEVIPSRLDIEKYGKVGVVGVSQFGPSQSYELYKRAFDSIMAAAGLALLGPAFLLISAFIKLDSRGPVFYSQTRIGRNGRPFKFYKFRSMTVGDDDDVERERKYAQLIRGEWDAVADEAPTKIVNEQRVTAIGKLLRRTSLDELPQLYNVLRGDMSLVGPRPCLPYEWKHYDEWHKRRLSVTPGCTGVWQVFGRSEVGFQDMVILDLFYSQNASIGLDLWLLFKTIPVMMFGRGGK